MVTECVCVCVCVCERERERHKECVQKYQHAVEKTLMSIREIKKEKKVSEQRGK